MENQGLSQPRPREGEAARRAREKRAEPITCPQFQTRMEEIPLKSGSAILPIRRCLLAERMVGLLRKNPAARSVVRALVSGSGRGAAALHPRP